MSNVKKWITQFHFNDKLIQETNEIFDVMQILSISK